MPNNATHEEYHQAMRPWYQWVAQQDMPVPWVHLLAEREWRERTQKPVALCEHDEAVLQALADAEVVIVAEPLTEGPIGRSAIYVTVADAMLALPVPPDRRAELWEAVEDSLLVITTTDDRQILCLPFERLMQDVVLLGTHPVCVAFREWLYEEFVPAIARYGHYAPATSHEPPPSQLLEALEAQEELLDRMDKAMPGMGSLMRFMHRPADEPLSCVMCGASLRGAERRQAHPEAARTWWCDDCRRTCLSCGAQLLQPLEDFCEAHHPRQALEEE
jgi:hypothetical protein